MSDPIEVSLREQILNLSRQTQIGDLFPFLSDTSDKAIAAEYFLKPDRLADATHRSFRPPPIIAEGAEKPARKRRQTLMESSLQYRKHRKVAQKSAVSRGSYVSWAQSQDCVAVLSV